MTTIIDLTRAWAGTEAEVLAAVFDALPEDERGPVQVRAYSRQHPAISDLVATKGAKVGTIGDGATETVVVNSVNEAIREHIHIGDLVRVYSFSPAVRESVGMWSSVVGDRVAYAPLAPFAVHSEHPEAPATAWDNSFMPEAEATGILVEAMVNTPSHSVEKVDVRALLKARDPRFGKEAGGFAAAPRFVSLLLDSARRRGLVIIEGQHPRTTVSLTEAGIRSAQARVKPAAPDVRVVPAPKADVTADPASAVTRSAQFISALRSANLGPFMSVRTAVYQQIDATISEEPKALKKVVSEAVSAVREADMIPVPDGFPWSRVRLFIESLMRRRPVALSDGDPIALGWVNGERQVNAMLEDWQLRLDGELVLHLIDQGMNIRMDDLPDLAGALYNGRDSGETDRAFEVVARLAADQLIDGVSPDAPLRRCSQETTSIPQTVGEAEPEAPAEDPKPPHEETQHEYHVRDLRVASEPEPHDSDGTQSPSRANDSGSEQLRHREPGTAS
jgi:hypothetical protein